MFISIRVELWSRSSYDLPAGDAIEEHPTYTGEPEVVNAKEADRRPFEEPCDLIVARPT
jgi:hypothetical protein